MKKLLFITILSTSLILGQGISITMAPVPFTSGDELYALAKISPNGKYALITQKGFSRIELVEIPTKASQLITKETPGAGWGIRWNPAGDRFIFKVNETGGGNTKSVSLFEYILGSTSQKLATLDPASNNLSFYSIKGNGISTEGKDGELSIIRQSESQNDVSFYISNGKVILNDRSGSLGSGVSEQIKLIENVLFAEWSPSGKKLAIHSAGKGIYIFDFESGKEFNFPKTEYPSWINDNYFSYMITEDDGYRLLNSDIVVSKFDGTESGIVTNDFDTPAKYPSASQDGTILFTGTDNKIYIMKVDFRNN
ncbi:MAG: hypothetical protein IPN18_07355 [Ignavibacteriales bacterium]|nr:hypothetical protein [Ignavibacteriales bacterium]